MKCQSCHVNVQGGGVRNSTGWISRKDASIVPVGNLFDFASTNSVIDNMVTFGLDFRYQVAKFGGYADSNRQGIVMQASPYLVIDPFEWLTVEGFYNFAENKYVGQQTGAASIYIKPGENLPQLRAGYFQPTIGTKYDDHTLMIRQVVYKNYRVPLIPDDYAELGGQIDYIANENFDLSVGAFSAKNLSEVTCKDAEKNTIPLVDSNSISFTARGVYYMPTDIVDGVNAYAGMTYFLNDDFYIFSAFVNAGLSDKLSFGFEYMRSEKKDARLTMGFLGELSYILYDPLILYAKAERGVVREQWDTQAYFVNQYVFGAHVYLLPYIELIPEYRIYDNEHYEGYNSQWAFQLHVFY